MMVDNGAMNESWGGWDAAVHDAPDQVRRLASARKSAVTPTSVDPDTQSGIFPGSGKKPYEVTLSSCTCFDFQRRHLPCKHIYRLALELGCMDGDFDTGKNRYDWLKEQVSLRDTVAELEKLNDEDQERVKYLLRRTYYGGKGTLAINLTESPDLARSLLFDHQEKRGKTVISLSSRYEKCGRKLYTYLLRKFDWDEYLLEDGTVWKVPHGAKCEKVTTTRTIDEEGRTILTAEPLVLDTEFLWYFPSGEVTDLLTDFCCNRCLDGYEVKI